MEGAPKLHNPLLWQSFWELDPFRPFIAVAGLQTQILQGFIPPDKMHWHAETELKLTADERAAFVYIMRVVDKFYVRKVNSKSS